MTLTPLKPPHIRELTPRSVAVGLLVALVIGASYPYVVLKFGFGPNISVVSAFFGFVALGLFSKSYNRWENNVVQTAGTTAGQIAFLCWLLAAFDILAAEPGSGFDVHLTRMQTWIWLSVVWSAGRVSRRAAAQALHRGRAAAVPRRDGRGRDAHHARFARAGGADVGVCDDRRARALRPGLPRHAAQMAGRGRRRSGECVFGSSGSWIRRLAAQRRLGHHHRAPHQREHAHRRSDRMGRRRRRGCSSAG